MNDLRARF